MTIRILAIICVLATFLNAQSILEPAYGLWGIGVTSKDRNYIGTDTDIGVSPLIFGGYGPVWIEANRLGVTVYRDGTNFASVAAFFRSHQNRKDDKGLSDRKSSIDLGLHIGRRLGGGFTTRFAFLHDVTASHKSYELDLQVYRHDDIGPISLLSAVGIQYQDKKLVDYYYGTNSYKPAAAFGGELEFIATLPVGSFGIFAGTRIYFFDKEVKNSPIADGNRIDNFFLGFGYYL